MGTRFIEFLDWFSRGFSRAFLEGDRWKLTCEGGHRYDDAVRRLAAAAQAEKETAGHRGAGASPRVAASA